MVRVTWQPGSHLFALEHAFWAARKQETFTAQDIVNADITSPLFRRIRNLTVANLFTPSTIKSGGVFQTFDADLLQFMQQNVAGEVQALTV